MNPVTHWIVRSIVQIPLFAVYILAAQLIADPSFWRPLAREKAVRVADAFSKAVGR